MAATLAAGERAYHGWLAAGAGAQGRQPARE